MEDVNNAQKLLQLSAVEKMPYTTCSCFLAVVVLTVFCVSCRGKRNWNLLCHSNASPLYNSVDHSNTLSLLLKIVKVNADYINIAVSLGH